MSKKNWEETVIKPGELGLAIVKHPELPMGQAIAIEQAEISFKAGYREGVTKASYFLPGKSKAIELRGMGQVVDWMMENNTESWVFSKADGSESHPVSIRLEWQKVQAKLKEWGIQ